jgi:general secretion pathway protein G
MARLKVFACAVRLIRSTARESWPVARDPWSESPSATPKCGWVGGRTPDHGPRTTGRVGVSGFTLIELIVVVAIIGILAGIAVPAMKTAPIRAREAALKEDLFTLRSCIDQFHADRARYPTSLEELVSMGYLRSLPVDPVTRSAETWKTVPEQPGEEDDERSQDAGMGQGIIDVFSGSEDTALDGTLYKDW